MVKRVKHVDMFESRSQMNSEMLESDIDFLFQGIDAVNKAGSSSTATGATATSKPNNAQVVKRAKQQGCMVMIMPPSLSQHIRNNSRIAQKRIAWRVEVMNGNQERRVLENVDEDTLVEDIVGNADGDTIELEQFEQPRATVSTKQTLQACLNGKTIVEFPIFHVLQK